MNDDPKIRVVVSKRQLASDLRVLSGLLEEYGAFLAALDPPGDWTESARRLLKRHWDQLDFAKVSLQSLDLVGALIRQVLALQPGKRILFSEIETPTATPEPPAAAAATSPPQDFRALAAEMASLLSNAPLVMQEKLRFLLGSLLRMVSQVSAKDIGRLEEVLSEINLLTSSRESQSLVREIALLAREVYDSIQAMSEGLPLEALTESTEGASEAVRKLNGVMKRLEEAASQNLDQVEALIRRLEGDQAAAEELTQALRTIQQRLAELKAAHPRNAEALERIQTRLSDDVGATAMQLRMRAGATSERYMALLSSQGFQDHTGTTLRRIVAFVEQLQGQLLALLEKYQSVLALHLGPPDLSEEPMEGADQSGARQSQDEVDRLLAKLGV
jgi:chemotaxis regulatin CheY-phosphate phosphatase CheZ